MTVEITMDNVLPMLKQAVDTRGRDYKYHNHFQACRYSVDGGQTPACLIGVLIFQQSDNPDCALQCAINYTDVADLFGHGMANFDDQSLDVATDPKNYVDHLLFATDHATDPLPGFTITMDALRVLKAAQNVQDDMHVTRTWGQAYDTAEQVHALLMAKVA